MATQVGRKCEDLLVCNDPDVLSRVSGISPRKLSGWTQFVYVKQAKREQHTRFWHESETADI